MILTIQPRVASDNSQIRLPSLVQEASIRWEIPTSWPLWSPDVIPCDFYYLGRTVKDQHIYHTLFHATSTIWGGLWKTSIYITLYSMRLLLSGVDCERPEYIPHFIPCDFYLGRTVKDQNLYHRPPMPRPWRICEWLRYRPDMFSNGALIEHHEINILTSTQFWGRFIFASVNV
jgi:hypothetical protein